MRFGIVVSRFNSFITERLLAGALDALARGGASAKQSDVVRVPGAFEIPLAAKKMALAGSYDAIIAIGCVLRGETAHFDYVATEVARGVQLAQMDTGVPIIFCVLTCDTLEQAIDRAGLKSGNKGYDAGLAAIEMGQLSRKLRAAKRSSSSALFLPLLLPLVLRRALLLEVLVNFRRGLRAALRPCLQRARRRSAITMSSLRHKSREFALQMLFQWEIGHQEPRRIEDGFWRMAPAEKRTQEFANELVRGHRGGRRRTRRPGRRAIRITGGRNAWR